MSEKTNKWFAMSRKTDAEGAQSTDAEIKLYDRIGMGAITASDFIDELNALGDVETINLRIQSGGGDIVQGVSIFNALKRNKAKIVTHIDSLAASMASVIAMAGDEVRMASNAMFMIHKPWTGIIGNAEALRKKADILDDMQSNIMQSYDRSNLSAEELEAMLSEDTWMTAQKAKDAGFIDYIDDANLAAASIGDMETLKDFSAIPQAKIDGIKIECQARQIETLDMKATELAGELDCEREKVVIAEASLVEADKAMTTLKTDHVAELDAAKVVTDEAVSARAAEQLQADGTPAIETAPEGNGEQSKAKMTESEFWAEYESQPVAEQNAWYAENQSLISK